MQKAAHKAMRTPTSRKQKITKEDPHRSYPYSFHSLSSPFSNPTSPIASAATVHLHSTRRQPSLISTPLTLQPVLKCDTNRQKPPCKDFSWTCDQSSKPKAQLIDGSITRTDQTYDTKRNVGHGSIRVFLDSILSNGCTTKFEPMGFVFDGLNNTMRLGRTYCTRSHHRATREAKPRRRPPPKHCRGCPRGGYHGIGR